MSAAPSDTVLHWAASVMGHDARVVRTQSLHGQASPWLLHIDHENRTHEVVLRIVSSGRLDMSAIQTGAAALVVAEDHGLAVPHLLAWDRTGIAAGEIASLETVLPGTSELSAKMRVAQLHDAGAAIAKVHAVPLNPQPHLPLRTRPIQLDDYARDRRWATLYRASSSRDRSDVIDAFKAWTGMSEVDARSVLSRVTTTPLLHLGDEQVRKHGIPSEPTVLVHGDVWPGNMRWVGDTCTALIDWKIAGTGNPGVDLGSLRMQVALRYGTTASDHVRFGWERQAGRAATDVPYWDAVAALNTPTEMDGWPGFDERGQPASAKVVGERRDAFLREALDQLGHRA